MATQGERRALLFLAALAILGAGTRLWRSKRPPAESTTTLDAQIAAVDSSQGPRVRPGRRSATSTPNSAIRVDLDVLFDFSGSYAIPLVLTLGLGGGSGFQW